MKPRPTVRTHRSLCWPALLTWLGAVAAVAACAAVEENSPYGEEPADLESTSSTETTMGGASAVTSGGTDVVTVTLGSSSTTSSDEATATATTGGSGGDTGSGGTGGDSGSGGGASTETVSTEASSTVSSGGASSTMASVTMSSTMASATMGNANMVNTVSTTGGGTGGCAPGGNVIHDFDTWNAADSFTYTGTGSSVATSHNSGAGTLSITATNDNYVGVGLVLDSCIDASGCSGIAFDIGGSVGGGDAVIQLRSEANLGTADGGTCASNCSNNESTYTVSSGVQSVQVPWNSLSGGSPSSPASGEGVCGFQWQFHCAEGGACAVDVTLDNLRFY